MAADFASLLARFTAAVEAADGAALAALFTEDGLYDDTFYGAFRGRAAIRAMLEDHFWRDGTAFRWDMRDPVSDGRTGYASWLFSYTARLAPFTGRRVVVAGMSRFALAGGLIIHYAEAFDAGQAFRQLGMAPDRLAVVLDRMNARFLAATELGRHRGAD
ncbi:MAG: nuclear transport factor 2 family protein [Alphaproteobacteria bacterium]|nr:nuclear transport factor 2 family protein [Alphaproteobacteria bacterium]